MSEPASSDVVTTLVPIPVPEILTAKRTLKKKDIRKHMGIEDITPEDIAALFPALQKLDIIKEEEEKKNNETSKIQESIQESYESLSTALTTYDERLYDILMTEVSKNRTVSKNRNNIKKNVNPDHPSHFKRQQLFESIQQLRASDEQLRDKLAGLQSLILIKQKQHTNIFNALLLCVNYKLKRLDETQDKYEQLNNLRVMGSVCNVGYSLPVNRTHSLYHQERENVHIILPLETKKSVLEYIVSNYQEQDKDKVIKLKTIKSDWYNIIVDNLQQDIELYGKNVADRTDWRQVYQLYEYHNDVENLPDCEELALQLNSLWLHNEVVLSIHQRRHQEEVARQEYKESVEKSQQQKTQEEEIKKQS